MSEMSCAQIEWISVQPGHWWYYWLDLPSISIHLNEFDKNDRFLLYLSWFLL